MPGFRPSLVLKASQTCGRLSEPSGFSPQPPERLTVPALRGWDRFPFRSRRAAVRAWQATYSPGSNETRILRRWAYLSRMRKSAFEPCIPTRGTTVPTGNDWIHEIKHDGYRLIVQRDGQRVRLFTRNGHDWSGRFPLITEAALRNRNSSFVLDGEAVLLGVDGISDFNGLHSRKHDDEVMFYAFDILVSDGEDLRKLPLHLRKNNLARLLARRVNGIFLADFEQGEIGPDLFRHACLMGLEGLVSKHKDRPYRAGRSPHWVKVKNREHPAMERVMDTFS